MREPWPWLLMAGPALVLLAGVATTWIAFRHEDGLVADDYYRRGLAINRDLGRIQFAADRNLRARVSVGESAIRVWLTGQTDLPDRVTLRLIHPVRASEDLVLSVTRQPGGWYEGSFGIRSIGGLRWSMSLEDEAGQWRLTGRLSTTESVLAAR